MKVESTVTINLNKQRFELSRSEAIELCDLLRKELFEIKNSTAAKDVLGEGPYTLRQPARVPTMRDEWNREY